MLRELAAPWGNGEKVKVAIGRAAQLARLAYWRTFDLWYLKARRVEIYELDQIREALRIKNEKAARNELHELKLTIARLESRLNSGDADFYSAHLDGLRASTAPLGRKNRTTPD